MTDSPTTGSPTSTFGERPPYAAAMIRFLNRDTGEQKAMTYPVTEVILIDILPREQGLLRRTFKVSAEGKWEEVEGTVI